MAVKEQSQIGNRQSSGGRRSSVIGRIFREDEIE